MSSRPTAAVYQVRAESGTVVETALPSGASAEVLAQIGPAPVPVSAYRRNRSGPNPEGFMRRSRMLLAAGVMVLAVSARPADAAPVLITFDDVQGMSNSPGLPVPSASQLSDQDLALTGALFAFQSPFIAVVNLTSQGPNHAITNPNGIGGVNSSGQLSYSTPIEISFFETATGLPGVTDFVRIRGDQIAIAGTATLTGFGLHGEVLGSFTADDVAGGLTLTLSLTGIHRVLLSETSGTIAFDNLEFNAPGAVAVSEPASVFLLGIGAAGLLAKFRRWRTPATNETRR